MLRFSLLFSVCAACVSCADLFPGTDGDRVIVVAEEGTLLSDLEDAVARFGGVPSRHLPLINAISATLPDDAAAADILRAVGVARLDPDVPVSIVQAEDAAKPGGGGSTQPAQSTPWGVARVGAPDAWSSSRGAGVVVSVIDTGADQDHPDLVANLAGGVNFSSSKGGSPTAWDDDNGHGTHVSGTVAAVDNAIGVVGVAPSASLLACKALDRNGSGWLADIIACLDWSVANGADVVNMSLGTSSDVQSLHDACDAASAAGLLLVAAAGNSGDGNPATDNVIYPAKYGSVVAVAATTQTDAVASFSSDGPDVELSAPGASVLSTKRGGGYGNLSGTSMASPHVAGVGALLLGGTPGLTAACARNAMNASATDLGTPGLDVFFGNGLVNAPAALSTAAAATCP